MFLLLACTADPDGLLRKGELAGAAHAWEVAGNPVIDTTLAGVDALGRRARLDPTVTLPLLAEVTPALRLLERFPQAKTRQLDVPIEKLADLGAALDALATPPAVWVVARSSNLADKDPWTEGGALPWKAGRLVGFAPAASTSSFTAPSMEALGAMVDADPPSKLVSLAMADATGEVFVTIEREGGAWFSISTTDQPSAARLMLAAGDIRDYGATALRAREGGGFVRK
jgi:hypothetical protein